MCADASVNQWLVMLVPVPDTLAGLISFAGLDGAGKTTQARLLADWLSSLRYRVAVDAPNGPSFTRSLLNELASDLGLDDHQQVFGPQATALLTAFMRYRDWADRVIPAMRACDWVVTDRSAVCHYAAAHAVGADNEAELRLMLSKLPKPDLTVYLDVGPDEAFRRLTGRGAGLEEASFLVGNERGYRRLPEFGTFAVVTGSGSVAQVQDRVRLAVCQRFPALLADAGRTDRADQAGA